MREILNYGDALANVDFEAPVDAWYVWFGVGIVSVALAGIALGLPTAPPPDANAAANSIDTVVGSPYNASATLEHDADAIKVDNRTIALRNDHGESSASLAFEEVIYVTDERPRNVTYGSSMSAEFGGPGKSASTSTQFITTLADEANTDWQPAGGELVVRTITWNAQYDGVPPSQYDDVADLHTWLTYDDDTGEFRVTLVTS